MGLLSVFCMLDYPWPVGLPPASWVTPVLLGYPWPVGLPPACWATPGLLGYSPPFVRWTFPGLLGTSLPVGLTLACWAIPSLLGYPLTHWATPHHQPVGLSPGARIVVLLPTF